MVLGTLSYMSPEQVRGQRVDHRSDIFSFGCVVYEIVSGQKPFRGATGADVMAAIVKEDPAALPEAVPPALQRIVWQCLEKKPEDRFSSAHDLALALQAAVSDVVVVPGSVSVSPLRWTRLAVLGAAVACLAVVITAIVWLRSDRRGPGTAATLDPAKVLVVPFENLTGDPSFDPIAALTADAITQGLVELGEVEVVTSPTGSAPRDDAALRAAARAAGAGTLVSGSYYLAGDTLDLRGRVIDVASGKPIYALKPERGTRLQPADSIDHVKQRVMGALVLHLGRAPGLGGLTTPPLYSAYQEYVVGVKMLGGDSRAAAQHLERAAELDPEFWHPQIRLRPIYYFRDKARYKVLEQHLQANQDKFGPTDRIMMEYYDAVLARRFLEALRKAREMLALAPHDFAHILVAAGLALELNRPREALACIGDIEALDWKTFRQWRQGTWLLGAAAFAHHVLGEYEAELEVTSFGLSLYPDALDTRQDQVRALAALGRVAEVERAIEESLAIRARGDTPGEVMLTAAQELRAHGHADASRRVAARGAAWYAGLTGEEASPLAMPLNRVECLWLAERLDEARALADSVVETAPQDVWALGYRGILAARAGDRPVVEAMERQLTAVDAKRARGNPTYLRACIAAQLGARDRAIELLREALARGLQARAYLHVYVFLEPLHGYPPFEELLKPQG